MPTKAQAKAAVDAACTAMKTEIDDRLPTGADITDGKIDFGPTKMYVKLTAPNKATADSWASTISTNLTSAGRQHRVRKEGQYVDDERLEQVTITSALCVYVINF